MKKAIIFLGLFIAPALFILFTAGCKKDDDSSTFGESGSVISGIVMDEHHNPVTNGEVHIITPEGRAQMFGDCDRTETIVKTDERGYFKAEVAKRCKVVDNAEMLVFSEDGSRLYDVYASLDIIRLSQSFIDTSGFNSPNGMFFPKSLGYFDNIVELKKEGRGSFDVHDTLYFLLPPDAWADKDWHYKKIPLTDINNNSIDFLFKWTFSSNYFLKYYQFQNPYAIFITDNVEFVNNNEDIWQGHIADMNRFLSEYEWLSNFQMITHPHQNIGGENHIYLTVKKENGKIVVKEQDQSTE